MGYTSGKAKYRHNQNESLMLNVLNNTLKYEMNDPIFKMVSFTYVRLSGDKSYLNVYVDTYDHKNLNKILNELNKASGTFRTALAQKTKFYKVPKIIFNEDKTISNSIHIEELINKINKGE